MSKASEKGRPRETWLFSLPPSILSSLFPLALFTTPPIVLKLLSTASLPVLCKNNSPRWVTSFLALPSLSDWLWVVVTLSDKSGCGSTFSEATSLLLVVLLPLLLSKPPKAPPPPPPTAELFRRAKYCLYKQNQFLFFSRKTPRATVYSGILFAVRENVLHRVQVFKCIHFHLC